MSILARAWRMVRVPVLSAVALLLWCSVFDLLPAGIRVGMYRLVPEPAREAHVNYVLSERTGFLRSKSDKIGVLNLLADGQVLGVNLIDNYHVLIPYTQGNMLRQWPELHEGQEDHFAPIDRLIFQIGDPALVLDTFRFHAARPDGVTGMCFDMFRLRMENLYREARATFCSGYVLPPLDETASNEP